MDKLHLKKMSNYFQSRHQDLQPIFAKVKLLTEIHQQLTAYLDPYLASQCQTANLVNNKLVLITVNASIATQLRYQSVELLKRLQENALLKHIQHIEIKVRPALHAAALRQDTLKKMPLLSSATAAIVREIAETVADPRLKEIIKRIAKRTKSDADKK